MENKKSQTCCFIGHRNVVETEELKNKLISIIQYLIENKKADTFLFGSKSRFNDLCYDVVTLLKQKYPYIKRIYVRAEFPYIDDDYKDFLLQHYEDTYYPQKVLNSGKAAYVERNCLMIDYSSFCVAYYDKNYTPPHRKNSRVSASNYQPKSGTRFACIYAKKQGTQVINVFKNRVAE